MQRRTLLKAGGMAILGLGFGGCATTRGGRRVPARPTPVRLGVNLPPVEASWDRVIRTTVGLRPHRPTGFVLRAEKLDAKTIIHNYGHGGGGHSLGWGTGFLVADLAVEQGDRRVAVIGCGTVGLTAGRQLQRRGFDVTIYAMSVPPDTTSNMALAFFSPASGLFSAARSAEWDMQFRRAAEISYRQLQLLVGPHYGVSWLDNYTFTDVPSQESSPTAAAADANPLLPPSVSVRTGRVVLGPGEHPFPSKYATRGLVMRIEPSIYLDAILRDFLLFGGRVVIRKFDTPHDVMTLSESLIINCTGLGSRGLFGDQELIPVKGQLTFLVPQPDINYFASGAMPRSDGIALSGTQERGVWTLEPNEEARRRIVQGAIDFFTAMRGPVPDAPFKSSEAAREVPSLDSFFDLES